MKTIQWYINEINKSSNVKLSFHKDAENWELKVIVTWDYGFVSTEYFDSLNEAKAYLRGFLDALPF